MRSDGGSAFPSKQYVAAGMPCVENRGMTMRQWYKGMAMIGVLATRPTTTEDDPRDGQTIIAESAASIADAMIAEDEKGEE